MNQVLVMSNFPSFALLPESTARSRHCTTPAAAREPYSDAAAAPFTNVTVLTQPAKAFSAPEPLDLVFTSQNYHDYPDPFMGKVDPAVAGTELDLTRAPQNYTWVKRMHGELLLAHGRDPYFPGWPDTLQLDYGNKATQQAMIDDDAAPHQLEPGHVHHFLTAR